MADSSPAGPAPAAAPPAPNPAVSELLRSASPSAGSPATPVTPITSARSSAGGRPPSDNPEAIRARRRRAAARASGSGDTAPAPAGRASFVRPRAGSGPKLTGDQFHQERAQIPVASAPTTPEQLDKARRNIALLVRGAGWAAAAIFKREYMRVEEKDALDTADAVLDGYPELANESDADYRKILAWAAVGSLAFERYARYRREEPPAAVTAEATPTPPTPKPAETPAGKIFVDVTALHQS